VAVAERLRLSPTKRVQLVGCVVMVGGEIFCVHFAQNSLLPVLPRGMVVMAEPVRLLLSCQPENV